MAQWREQCRRARRTAIPPPMLDLTLIPHILPKHPLPPNPYLPWTQLSTHLPSWPNKPTHSLVAPELPPFPQGNDIVTTLCRLNEAGEGLTDEVLLEWALDILCSLEDWRWLWSLEPAKIPLSSLTLNPLTPPQYNASNVNPLNTSDPNALNTSAPFVASLLPDTPNGPVSCNLVPFAENSAMWAPVVQLQLQLACPLSLPAWVTWEDLEPVPQGYEGGNVTVEEAPTSFSPFSLVDCTLLSHFLFNDFVTVAFPDLAKDLDSQI